MNQAVIKTLTVLGYYAIAYLISGLLGFAIIRPILNALYHKIEQSSSKDNVSKVATGDEKRGQLEGFLGTTLGILEQFAYTTSILLGRPEFVGVWLILKAVDEYKREVRTYNVYLLGTLLSVIIGVGSGLLIQQLLPPFPSLALWKIPSP